VISAASGAVDFRTVTNWQPALRGHPRRRARRHPAQGWRGGVRNILVGVALIAVLRNRNDADRFHDADQDMLKGFVLLIAVVTDNYLNPTGHRDGHRSAISKNR
jgi:ribose transport system permease protein